jgi:hypothetical protein
MAEGADRPSYFRISCVDTTRLILDYFDEQPYSSIIPP